jgi:hypothetical protein
VVRIMASVYAAEPAAAAQPPPAAMPAASSQAEQPALQAGQPSAAAQQPVREPEEALPLPRLHRAAAAGDADKVCQATAASLQPGPPSMCLTLCHITACRCACKDMCADFTASCSWCCPASLPCN